VAATRGSPGPRRRPATGRPRPGPAGGIPVEITFLPGLRAVVADEVVQRLGPDRPPRPVPGRDDALRVDLVGPLHDALELRTAVAAFVVRHFDVPRPRSLTSGDHLARIVDAVYVSLRVAGSSSFRFEAAGSDSAVFARLAVLLHEATGLTHEPEHGELVVRVVRGHGTRPDADPGWDVLVRLGPRPLSARRWREVDLPGAANATIAAAMSRLAGIRRDDCVLNLMCGSGTLIIERLLSGPAAGAVAVDDDPAALDAARTNLRAAALRTVRLVQADATSPSALVGALHDERFDLVLADPPWGTLHGSHETGPAVHAGLLAAAHAVTAPGGRLIVLTHEVRVMEQAVADAATLWTPDDEPLRVFAKGHHPRIWVLRRSAR
jgi:16S rRNA G966 N2-methylase RsmD